jgi:hypothetical protein
MSSSWVIHRFRLAFLQENLVLITLRLLRSSELSEWEALDSIYSRYRLAPDAKEFRKVLDVLVSGGYVSSEPADELRKLRITRAGMKLLHALEEEYRAIVLSMETEAPGPIAR